MNSTELVDAYLNGIESLGQAVTGMKAEQLRARPVPGKWSTLEVVCHLADSEALFAERMRRVLSEDRPTLPYSDPDQQPTALAYDVRNASEEVALIGLIRRQMARILQAQSLEAWRRVGVHSTDGEKTLEQLVRKAVDHLDHHLAFIEAKRQALGVG